MTTRPASVPMGIERQLVLLTFFTIVVFAWLAGPIRWVLVLSGLAMLAYLPTLSMLGLAGLREMRDICMGQWSWVRFLLCWALLAALITGVLHVPSKVQVGFGFYVLSPFLFGLVVAPLIFSTWQKHLYLISFFWLLVLIGVVADSLNVPFPWVGLKVSVGDVEVEAAREWHAGESRRLSGFSRASFDAASQILITLAFLLAVPGGYIKRVLLIAISAYGIILTTAKGMLLVLAVMTPIMLCPPRFFRHMVRLTIGGVAFMGILLPIIGLAHEWHFDLKSKAAKLILFSFEDRLRNMWPEAIHLVVESGNYLLGRGIGGLGVAQTYFEPHRFNAADNIYVYTYVIFGSLGIALLIWMITRLMRCDYQCQPNDRLIAGFSIVVLVYGLTTNVFEAQMLALTLGVLVRTAFDDRYMKPPSGSHPSGDSP